MCLDASAFFDKSWIAQREDEKPAEQQAEVTAQEPVVNYRYKFPERLFSAAAAPVFKSSAAADAFVMSLGIEVFAAAHKSSTRTRSSPLLRV